MLAYICNNCGKFTISPLIDEYKNYFCGQECCEDYYKGFPYDIYLNRILFSKNILKEI